MRDLAEQRDLILHPRARLTRPAYLEGYPLWGRGVIVWYDSLSDWQRVRYVLVIIAFLLACLGYILGLGSTILLQHVESQEQELAAQRLLTPEPTPEAVFVPADLPTEPPTPTARAATATPKPAPPTPTPFSAPVIQEQPAAPRVLPAAPVAPAPARPAVVATATPTPKPRNVENATPIVPTAIARTPAAAGTTPRLAATATLEAGTPRPTPKPTPLPTLRIPPTSAPTAVKTAAPTTPQPQLTPGKTSTPTR